MLRIKWGEHTGRELAQAVQDNALIILPLGCTEQHALHLPVDTDTYQVERISLEGAARAAEVHGVRVLVLPALPYGPASEHYGLPGTVSLPNETYLQVVKQLLWSVVELGFKRLAVVRGCGGHWIVPGVVWDLKADARRHGYDVTLRIMVVDEDWRALKEKHFPGTDGGHAAVMETALCLAERLHLVQLNEMRAPELKMLNERYRVGGEAFLFNEVTDTGGLGDPSPATMEGGRALWGDMIEAFAKKLKYLEDQDRQLNRF
jgi:creatinine amidohydrolase/Fe(II)-dependent formamide hydrolase-like protein